MLYLHLNYSVGPPPLLIVVVEATLIQSKKHFKGLFPFNGFPSQAASISFIFL